MSVQSRFLGVIKSYWALFILLIVILIYLGRTGYARYQLNTYFQSPQSGDIYIVNFEDTLSPLFLDMVRADSLYFFSHPYHFNGGVPALQDLNADGFNTDYHWIYSQADIMAYFEEGRIEKIYRTCQSE